MSAIISFCSSALPSSKSSGSSDTGSGVGSGSFSFFGLPLFSVGLSTSGTSIFTGSLSGTYRYGGTGSASFFHRLIIASFFLGYNLFPMYY